MRTYFVGAAERYGISSPPQYLYFFRDNYFDRELVPNDPGFAESSPLSREELEDIATYANEWDISPDDSGEDTIWKITTDGNHLPRLAWELED